MTPPPAYPKIYHITHVDNLAATALADVAHRPAIEVHPEWYF